jgi:hypothetical protein
MEPQDRKKGEQPKHDYDGECSQQQIDNIGA